MKKLFATYHAGKWWVSSDRLSGYAPVAGEGHSLPGAYLNYLRAFERVAQRNKSTKAEEQRCIDAIKKIERKEKTDYTPEMDMLPEEFYGPSKRWWQFWK